MAALSVELRGRRCTAVLLLLVVVIAPPLRRGGADTIATSLLLGGSSVDASFDPVSMVAQQPISVLLFFFDLIMKEKG